MASAAAVFSSLRRRRSPSLETFLTPVNLTQTTLIKTLTAVSSGIISEFSSKTLPFQRKNARSLVWKIQVIQILLECFWDSGLNKFNSTANLCFKEMYLWLYRSKILLDYCFQSSKIWFVIQNHAISSHFHDLNREILTLLDVLPLNELNLSVDVKEQVELLKRQCERAKLVIDKHDELLMVKLYEFLDEFGNGNAIDSKELCSFFVEKLGMCDVTSCRVEIEFLEEQIANHDGDLEPSLPVLGGLVGLIRYCRFLVFGFDQEDEIELENGKHKKLRKSLVNKEIGDLFVTIPKDFVCPISLDLMRDPVTISTGQTYERASVSRWMEEGHCNCPKTGQMLVHTRLVPNWALRNLILHWCTAHGIPYDPPESAESFCRKFLAASPSKAAIEANKATVGLLINQVANGTKGAKTIAARELRLLSKTGRENRAYIAEAGAIPLLKELLPSPNAVAQENSVTAILNLSIYEKNKSRIMDEKGCLGSIVRVLRFGHTTEARENAAATLFSLCAVHDYKKRIAEENGAVEALAGLLREGTPRGKKDAVTALFNLSTHSDNCMKMIESGASTALVRALGCEGVAEEAAGALALIVRQPLGAEAVGKEEMAVAGLIGMLRCGTPKAKENAVAALLEFCRSGGAPATERVSKAPALADLLQTLLFTGTKRARRKAASLARVFQRCQNAAQYFRGSGGRYYAFIGNLDTNIDSSFADFTRPLSISVPVL